MSDTKQAEAPGASTVACIYAKATPPARWEMSIIDSQCHLTTRRAHCQQGLTVIPFWAEQDVLQRLFFTTEEPPICPPLLMKHIDFRVNREGKRNTQSIIVIKPNQESWCLHSTAVKMVCAVELCTFSLSNYAHYKWKNPLSFGIVMRYCNLHILAFLLCSFLTRLKRTDWLIQPSLPLMKMFSRVKLISFSLSHLQKYINTLSHDSFIPGDKLGDKVARKINTKKKNNCHFDRLFVPLVDRQLGRKLSEKSCHICPSTLYVLSVVAVQQTS